MRWFLPERRGSHRHLHLIICLGLGMLGSFLLGLGLVKLWFASTLWACILGGSLAAILAPPRLRYFSGRLRAGGALGWVLVSLPVACLAAFVLSPYLFHDTLALHLGLPQQAWLEHGLIADQLIVNSKLPILSEMLWVWAICLDEERIYKLATALVGCLAFAAMLSLCRRFQDRRDWWLIPWFAGIPVIWGLQFAKPDIVAMALVAAALACADRFWENRTCGNDRGPLADPKPANLALAWLLLGFAMSVKYTAILGVAVVLLWGPLRYCLPFSFVAANLPWAALIAVPLLPWWARDYFLYGNPFYVALSDLFPALGFDPECLAAMQFDHLRFAPGLNAGGGLFQVTWSQLTAHHLAFGLIAPAVFVPRISGPARRMIIAGIVLSFVNLALFMHPRHGITAVAVLAIGGSLAVADFARAFPLYLYRALKAIIGLVGIAACISGFEMLSAIRPFRYLQGKETRTEYWRKIYPGLAEIQEYINDREKPAALMLIGDPRAYGYRCRVLIGSHYGHAPLIWKLTKSSKGPREMRKRMRQLNIDCLALNSINALYHAEIHRYYPWTGAMLARYRDFLESYTKTVFRGSSISNAHGAFYAWRLLETPSPSRRRLFFMPGTEWIWLDAQRLIYRERPRDFISGLKRHIRSTGPFGQMDSIMAHALMWDGNWPEAYRLFRRSLSYGIIDDQNLFGLAIAALETGRFEESEKLFQEARAVYPERQGIIEEFMPTIPFRWGERALSAGDFKRAENEYRRCLDFLDRREPSDDRDLSKARALMRLGKIRALRGNLKEATAFLEQACATSPSAMETEEAAQLSILLEKTR